MQTVSNSNFGPLIAYLVPGATALWGFSLFSPSLAAWFAATPENAPTISGFLYLTVASLAAGMTITAVRWAIVDQFHAITGLRPPKLDFSRLASSVDAFNLLIDIHYKFYQFHGNSLFALFFVYMARRIHEGSFGASFGWLDFGFVILSVILFVGSRDTLRKYYSRVSQLLGSGSPEQQSVVVLHSRRRQRSSSSHSGAGRLGGQHNLPAHRSSRN